MNFLSKSVYPHLPVFAQNWAISAYGYYWYKRRFGGIFQEELRKFKERENFTAQQWRDYQTVKLRKLLCHAFETVPYYYHKYKKLGFRYSDFQKFELEDLPKLPFLEKNDLRKFGTSSLLSSKREKGGRFYSSSGSTGTPVKILYSQAFHQRITAAMEARVRNWAGVSRFDARGMIGGRRILPKAQNTPPFYRYNFFERQTYFSAYHISHKNARDYLEGIRRNSVEYMTGYAMSNFFLASIFEELELHPPELKAVITSSEKLTPEMRRMFQKVYKCRTYDSYSGVENSGLISECPSGSLVISPDIGIIEVLDDKGISTLPGREGEIITTGLLNFDQPLIRYRIGDCIKLSEKNSTSEGLEMPIVKEIIGRTEDVIITEDGRKMVRFHGIFIDLPDVIKGQVVQKDLNHFEVRILPSKNYKRTVDLVIIERMQSQVGERALVEIKLVEEIPLTPNGKFKAVVSEIK